MKKTLIVLHDSFLLKTFKIQLHNKTSNFDDIILVADSLAAQEVLEKTPIDLLVTDLKPAAFDTFNLLVLLAQKSPQAQIVLLLDFVGSNSFYLPTIHCFNHPQSLTDLTKLLSIIHADDFQNKFAADMLVVDFFELVQFARKTCLLEIGINQNKGLIFFNQGEIFDSFSSNSKGEQTVLEMFDKKCAEIRFRNIPKKSFRQKITIPLKVLIHDKLDFKDETELNNEASVKELEAKKQRVIKLLSKRLKEEIVVNKDVKKEEAKELFQADVSALKTDVKIQPNNELIGIDRMSLEESLKPIQEVDGYLASAIFDMSGEVLVQHNNSKYNVALIGANAIAMINSAVKAMNGAGLGKYNFIQVNSEKGIFGAVWAVEDQSVAAVLLEPNANIGMAKLMLAKVGEIAGSRLA